MGTHIQNTKSTVKAIQLHKIISQCLELVLQFASQEKFQVFPRFQQHPSNLLWGHLMHGQHLQFNIFIITLTHSWPSVYSKICLKCNPVILFCVLYLSSWSVSM